MEKMTCNKGERITLPIIGEQYIWQGLPHRCSRISWVREIRATAMDIFIVVKHGGCFFSRKLSLNRFWKLYAGPKRDIKIET